jgi:hypothetical protein
VLLETWNTLSWCFTFFDNKQRRLFVSDFVFDYYYPDGKGKDHPTTGQEDPERE